MLYRMNVLNETSANMLSPISIPNKLDWFLMVYLSGSFRLLHMQLQRIVFRTAILFKKRIEPKTNGTPVSNNSFSQILSIMNLMAICKILFTLNEF